MKITDEQLDVMLRSQKWIKPSADFTQNVMHKVAMLPAPAYVPVRKSARRYERAFLAVAALATVGLIIRFIEPVSHVAMDYLREAGFWLGLKSGLGYFAAYPILIMAIVGPLLAAAVASCALSGRCRLTRA